MGFLTLFKKKSSGNFVLLSIGSGSVHAALISRDKFGKVIVHKSAHQEFIFQQSFEVKRLVNSMLASLEKVSAEISRSVSEFMPKQALLVLGSPWYAPRSRITCYKADKPFKVTESLLGHIASKAWKEEETLSFPSGRRKNILMEQYITGISLNGYPTDNAEGKTAKEIEAAVFFSLVADKILYGIEDIIVKYFPGVPMVPHSCALTFFSEIQSRVVPKIKKYFIINVSAELTDIFLVSKSVLSEVISFPFGSHTLIRSISSTMSVSPTEAFSLIKMGDKSMEEETKKRFEKALEKPQEDWLSFFKDALSELYDRRGVLPSHFFIFSEAPEESERFMKFIARENFENTLFNKSKFSAIPFKQGALVKKIGFGETVEKSLRRSDIFDAEVNFLFSTCK